MNNSLFKDLNLIQFIDVIKNCESVHDVLNCVDTPSEKGFIYERLWDLIIKFGCCPIFNSEHTHLLGTVNTGKLKELQSLEKYLNDNKVTSGNSTGISDITTLHKATNTYNFISVKFFADEKSVKDYDAGDIVAMIKHNEINYSKSHIYFFVNDSYAFLKKIKNAHESSQYLTKYMKNEYILGINDLNNYFQQWKQFVNKYTIQEIDFLCGFRKEFLKLRFHQEMIVNQIMKQINNGETEFLNGCKTRSGKTYLAGGLIIKLFEKLKKLNVLIVTAAPTETIPQFLDDLLYKFVDFHYFNIIHIKKGTDLEILDINHENNIFIVSKQILQNYVDLKISPKLNTFQFNLMIFDENHHAGTTFKSENILNQYLSEDTIRIYMTATYRKTLQKWNISKDNCFYWEYEDECWCKQRNLKGLYEKHGQIAVDETIEKFKQNGQSVESMLSIYDKFPEMHFITTIFDEDRYNSIKEKIKDTKYGFSLETLFALNYNVECQIYSFKFLHEVSLILRYISGSQKEVDFKDGDNSIFKRIFNISTKKDSRTKLTNNYFTSQLWFLPCGIIGQPLKNISECLRTEMLFDSVLKNYEIMIINSDPKYKIKDLKSEINKREQQAKSENKRGLIILSGRMCVLGITLPLVDIVMLLNNSKGSDEIYQMISRCMTESFDGKKKCGFVVDLNYNRLIDTITGDHLISSDQSIECHSTQIEDKIKYIINHNLITLDYDYLDNKLIDKEKVIAKLIELWGKNPSNELESLLDKIKYFCLNIDSADQIRINKMFKECCKTSVSKSTIPLNDEDSQMLPNGIDMKKDDPNMKKDDPNMKKDDPNMKEDDPNMKEDDPNMKEDDPNMKEDKIEVLQPVSFTKDVLKYTLPLICFLNIKSNTDDIMQMIKNIQSDSYLLNIFNSQIKIWWELKDNNSIIEMIEYIFDKYIKKDNDIYDISKSFIKEMRSLIDDPEKLLEFIGLHLKPKSIEKKKNAEVFTPLRIVNEMLDQLPHEVWSNPNLKWLDPANGMGNFPIIIYLRLMKGLEESIPHDGERKKHILEKMLYMVELNTKNVHICKEIFDINDQYKLNLYNGDFLTFNPEHEWKINHFDIVIGNPPYNEAQKSTGSLPLYNKFIEKTIDKCQYLLFIVPSRWFSGGKGLDTFRKMMLKRNDIVSIKHFDKAEMIFEQVDIKGGVNYFLKNSKHNGFCNYNGTLINLSNNDILVENRYDNLIKRLSSYTRLISLYKSQDYYKIQTNDERFQDHPENETYTCYVSQQKGGVKYINKNFITKDVSNYKILVPDGAYKHGSGFGRRVIAGPNSVHSKTFISFNVKNEIEAKSLFSYLNCQLPNFLLSLRKNSQHTSSTTCSWIPLIPLDRIWTDNQLTDYFKLTSDDLSMINTPIIYCKQHDEIKTIEPKTKLQMKSTILVSNTLDDLSMITYSKQNDAIKTCPKIKLQTKPIIPIVSNLKTNKIKIALKM